LNKNKKKEWQSEKAEKAVKAEKWVQVNPKNLPNHDLTVQAFNSRWVVSTVS
jgi:hypothetical protein